MHVKVWNYNAWKTGFDRKLALLWSHLWNHSWYSHEISHMYWSWSLVGPEWNSYSVIGQTKYRQEAILNFQLQLQGLKNSCTAHYFSQKWRNGSHFDISIFKLYTTSLVVTQTFIKSHSATIMTIPNKFGGHTNIHSFKFLKLTELLKENWYWDCTLNSSWCDSTHFM